MQRAKKAIVRIGCHDCPSCCLPGDSGNLIVGHLYTLRRFPHSVRPGLHSLIFSLQSRIHGLPGFYLNLFELWSHTLWRNQISDWIIALHSIKDHVLFSVLSITASSLLERQSDSNAHNGQHLRGFKPISGKHCSQKDFALWKSQNRTAFAMASRGSETVSH